MDVNGLHELNNSQGHEAGDQMLRSVASGLRACFGSRHTYRVGGDEFIVFVCDAPAEDTKKRLRELAETLKGKGYFVSAGFARADVPIGDVDGLVKTAEKRMYAEKQAYYQDPANDRRAR